jgi:signal peptidase I
MYKTKHIKSNKLFPLIQDLLKDGMGTRITVTGMSMYPFLRENIDSVELSASNFESIHYGDIVLILRQSGEYVLHRVLRKGTDYFYMIGDAQQWIEGPLHPKQLIAVVTAVWRKDKRIECSSFWWRHLSSVWLKLRPFRCFLIRAYRCIRRIDKIHKNLYRRVRS